MIDERALDLGFQALDRATANGEDELVAFRKGIEAYEAARWRPIEEAPRDGSWLQMWFTGSTSPAIPIRWTESGWQDSMLTRWGDIALTEAKFRTIDPPSPASTPPAAEDAS